MVNSAENSEFGLIRQHFRRAVQHTEVGVGDDCAVFTPRPGQQLLVSTDMLVSGRHFFPEVAPEALGWKVAAVNISDIAAMGGLPRWITLAASLPTLDSAWVQAFSAGFWGCCAAHGVDVVGGDTTAGPLNLCATVFGEVPSGSAILRSGAHVGDDIWVSGTPGRAALALRELLGEWRWPETTPLTRAQDVAEADPAASLWIKGQRDCHHALLRPQPRVALGLRLRGLATACLDVSDGLLGDLQHILEESAVGAEIELSRLPMPWAALSPVGQKNGFFSSEKPDNTSFTGQFSVWAEDNQALIQECVLSGGDDYELVFTAPETQRDAVTALQAELSLPLTRIGRITAERERVWLLDAQGQRQRPARLGFDHFAGAATPASV